ncbi:hypothetical protein CLV58_106120 [Spirosoma oryzae]|uniref:Uncharacterized protein n=1 Tax=Spirosoma oryzae TaxID=1469603 RepID=A0A2T0T5H7_9BACT|nr:hypothetical protein [Spirosoma oryzae]PRY40935.1 hypothetical protein CLV58_106120 [Spirosoma oryzae]
MATKSYQYLEEGFLEAYLTGIVSEQERAEMKQYLSENPEAQAELNEVEISMEQFFMRRAVPPPPGLRDAVMNRINQNEIQQWRPEADESRARNSAKATNPESQYVHVEVDDTHIRVHKYWRPAFIAVFVLSKVFLIAGLYYYFKAGSVERELEQLRQQNSIQQTIPTRPLNTR